MKGILTLLAVLMSAQLVGHAQVTGRIVRLEAPASYSMGVYEMEVWSRGKNIALQNKALKFAGVSDRGRDINTRQEGLRLIDGKADFNRRGNATGMDYLDVPSDGVYTFHAPPEYIGATCEPGYDLRVWIDGEEWHLGQRFHGQGIWSVPLAKGAHKLLVSFADARHRDRTVHAPGLWRGYPTSWVVWTGEAPVIEISGPGLLKQPIPASWLRKQD